MDYGKLLDIYEQTEEHYDFDLLEIAAIDAAFQELVERGVELRDLPENASVWDQIEELIDNVTPMEKYLYEYILENFGESEARDPSYSTYELAKYLNNLPIILGADNGKIGDLLQRSE